MTIQVREANKNDIPGIVQIWEEFMELLRHTNQNYWKVKNGRIAFSEFLGNTFTKDNIFLSVAENIKNDLAGFTFAQIEILPEWFGSEQIGFIRYQAVSSKFQGIGAGRMMTEFVLDWFRSIGINRVELYVLNGLASSGYWSKIGFAEFMDRRFIEI